MTYDPREYWTNQPAMAVLRAHADQEAALMGVLDHLDPTSILEIGVGAGRIGQLLCERWPNANYTGIDISPGRIVEARRNLPWRVQLIEADLLQFVTPRTYDLVIAVEVLMHVRPQDLAAAVGRMKMWSNRHVVTVDWTEPIDGPIAPWNFLHDYEDHGLQPVVDVGRQSVHAWKRPA